MTISTPIPPKPTPEIVTHYCERMEEMLSDQGWRVEVNLREHALGPIISTMNDVVMEVQYIWVRSTTVHLRNGETMDLPLISRDTVPENLSDDEIWRDAYEIQNKIYRMKESNLDDRYWKLWDHLPNK